MPAIRNLQKNNARASPRIYGVPKRGEEDEDEEEEEASEQDFISSYFLSSTNFVRVFTASLFHYPLPRSLFYDFGGICIPRRQGGVISRPNTGTWFPRYTPEFFFFLSISLSSFSFFLYPRSFFTFFIPPRPG